MDWFRSWHGAPTDNKWLLIAKRAGVTPMMVSAVFWALLDYASQQEERGSVAGFDAETYAMWAGCDETDVIAIVNAMRAKGVITDGERLAAWEKRQPRREDDSSERVRRYRDKPKDDVTQKQVTNVTQCNACNGNVTQCNDNSDSETQCNPRLDKNRLEEIREDVATDVAAPTAQPTLLPAQEKIKRARRENPDKAHPAVQAYFDLHKRWPQNAQIALIVERDPPIANWVRAIRTWAGKGYNPQNIAAMLDWAENPSKIDKAANGYTTQDGKYIATNGAADDDDIPTYKKLAVLA
jgi:hypothetical protein